MSILRKIPDMIIIISFLGFAEYIITCLSIPTTIELFASGIVLIVGDIGIAGFMLWKSLGDIGILEDAIWGE